MRILIVENIKPKSKGGNLEWWEEQAGQAYGLAARDEFEVCIGIDEDGECPVIWDQTGEVTDVEAVMP